MQESHNKNCIQVQALDAKFRSLYTASSGLVNDSMETLRGYSKFVSALDLRKQTIIRKSGVFVRPGALRHKVFYGLGEGVPPSAHSSTAGAKKKARSRGKGWKL